MSFAPRLALLLLAAALAGCAGNATRGAPPQESTEAVAAADSGDPGSAAPQGHDAAEAIDPYESFNRSMYGFNRAIDRAVLRPVARGYATVVPSVLRKGVSNFFGNLQQPVTALNLLLQGRPGHAGAALGRFALNLTLGLGGVLDPASHANIPYRDLDFGQTFAHWGWDRSRYLVMPLFGPATFRDGWGKLINGRVSPIRALAEEEGPGVTLLYGIDARAWALGADAFLEGAEDEYALVRDAYLQRRRCQLVDCSEELPDYLSPDYEYEIPDFDWER